MKGAAPRAVVLVAAVYGCFLIFAQFAWVELLRDAGAGRVMERAALGVMAAAGIAGGFAAARRGASPGMIRVALGLTALAAASAPFAGAAWQWCAVSVATGLGLGVATVALAALVRGCCGPVGIGLGTGMGYAVCNLPWVFHASPVVQAWTGVAFAGLGMAVVPVRAEWRAAESARVPWWAAVAALAALVWLDSAAFFVIQHVGEMKAGTWGGTMVWRNAAVHLAVAVVAGWWLARGGERAVPVLAWVVLAVAGLAANGSATLPLAGWLYPAGVSLYSVALVAWPGWFGGADCPRAAGWRAAWLFALAGWVASANGIGMAQALGKVPVAFVIVSGAVVIGAMAFALPGRRRAALGVGAVLAAVAAGDAVRTPAAGSAAGRGRQIYLAEGCIHCHSQFIRPGPPDEALWGSAEVTRDARSGTPALIGNRRQGPDLATVGARRSAAWLREHFINPRALVPDSRMPAYPHLFTDGRGEDLIAFLVAEARKTTAPTVPDAAAWQPARGRAPDGGAGARAFAQWCAACHGPDGRGDGPLAKRLAGRPANLADGPWPRTAAGDDQFTETARVIKFGIPGSDMPGHETLDDARLLDLTEHVLGMRR